MIRTPVMAFRAPGPRSLMVTVLFTVRPGPTEGTDSFTVSSASPESDVKVKVIVYVKGSLL
ncbi:hypothetical protein ACFQ6V_02385 [Streptomyces roseifaciens]